MPCAGVCKRTGPAERLMYCQHTRAAECQAGLQHRVNRVLHYDMSNASAAARVVSCPRAASCHSMSCVSLDWQQCASAGLQCHGFQDACAQSIHCLWRQID